MLRQALQSTIKSSLRPFLLHNQTFSSAGGGIGSGTTGTGDKNQKDNLLNNASIPIVDYNDPDYLPLPEYRWRSDEPLEVRKARLVYQSRKRGMLENDLLLSTFIHKYLKDMSADLTEQYDKLINGVTNDWDIYYWAIGNKPTPPEHDNEIMNMLKKHAENLDREKRIRQPALD